MSLKDKSMSSFKGAADMDWIVYAVYFSCVEDLGAVGHWNAKENFDEVYWPGQRRRCR
jgi:hypothetical protein